MIVGKDQSGKTSLKKRIFADVCADEAEDELVKYTVKLVTGGGRTREDWCFFV